MTYYESVKGHTLTKSQVWHEIKYKHNLTDEDFDLFLKDCGDKTIYDAQVVLAWLGY